MNVHVIKDGTLQRYLMFYEAVAADGRRAIGAAASKDGIRGWKRLDRSVTLARHVSRTASACRCNDKEQVF
jgi:hypothetical protein